MNDRELRLRERIDTVTDERDRARADVDRLRRRLYKRTRHVWLLKRSLELWRQRALAKR